MNFYHLDDIPEDLRGYFEPAPQIGLEKTPEEYVAKMVEVFREVRRVLRDDGTLWLNLGDSYAANGQRSNNNGAGSSTMGWQGQRKETLNKAIGMKLPQVSHGLKPKDLVGIPWRVAFALQSDGWYLRSDIIWAKPNPMPESVTDRPTKSHEYIFLLSKQERHYYDHEAVKEPASIGWNGSDFTDARDIQIRPNTGRKPRQFGASKQDGTFRQDVGRTFLDNGLRNKRTVWTVATSPYSEAHFATFPEDLIKPCILAGSRAGDTVLDPFGGSGTTGQVALEFGRKAILIELNPKYIDLINRRTHVTPGLALV